MGTSTACSLQLAAGFSHYGTSERRFDCVGFQILSTAAGSDYEANNDTSVAAPVVADVATLVMFYSPGLGALEVKKLIVKAACKYQSQLYCSLIVAPK